MNRVTLLLAHSQDQKITQKKIEAYLSAAPHLMGQDDDPKGVSQRVQLVELYILHVLPRVGEWEYAREFTHMSGDLDDEQKEVCSNFLHQRYINLTKMGINWYLDVPSHP